MALHYNKLELCCYWRFIHIFMVKDKSPNPGTRNRKPVLVIPCSQTPTFWYIELWHHLRWWWWREWPVVKNYLTRYDKVLGNQVLMKFIKYIVSLSFSEPNRKNHNYINIWINLSNAANSIVFVFLGLLYIQSCIKTL